MSDYNELVRFMGARFPTCIQKITAQCKNQGKYILVGSIPIELTESRPTMYNRDHRDSMVWDSEQEVINALLSIGRDHFQLANNKFYGEA